jgi:hypothetical protein
VKRNNSIEADRWINSSGRLDRGFPAPAMDDADKITGILEATRAFRLI